MSNQQRNQFRQTVFDRDNHTCIVPWCESDAEDAHHIVERSLWENGGYVPNNGASVCETHHRAAEANSIPPQAFWRWADITTPPLPEGIETSHINKWGDELDAPPWKEHRQTIKYPSTRHLPWSHERDVDDTAHSEVEWGLDIPLVATIKMDGANSCILRDREEPIRARNGKQADKDHFDMAKSWYDDKTLYWKIAQVEGCEEDPDEVEPYLQIFGEWMYAKHSIHYGCDCETLCEDVGPALEDYFQVFGVYDTRYDLWLSWEETVEIADELDLTVVPPAEEMYHVGEFSNVQEFWDYFYDLSQNVVSEGHEGIIVRSARPFHYGEIDARLGKYVREDHVKEGEKHWSHRALVPNFLSE